MFFYAKKIVYLSLYEQDQRAGNAGFASLQGQQEGLNIKVQLKNTGEGWEGIFPVYLMTGQQEMNIGMISIRTGQGSYDRSFYCKEDKVCIGTSRIDPESIYGIQIRFPADRIIKGEMQQVRSVKGKQADTLRAEVEESAGEKSHGKTFPIPEIEKKKQEAEISGEELKAVSVHTDKWEQLKVQYGTVHPFGDEREFISIEPKDFVVLREAYQRLVNNSFLLHGFYNYRHLILGKDCQLGTGSDICFYLGVPGVFFEREKMVAVMFGFEGFESEGPVEIGKFGYYLRRVEI